MAKSNTKIETQATETPATVTKLCVCGCGLPVIRNKATFVPSHDAKLAACFRRLLKGQAKPEDAERVNAAWPIVQASPYFRKFVAPSVAAL